VFLGVRQRLWASSRAAIAVIIVEIDLDLVHFHHIDSEGLNVKTCAGLANHVQNAEGANVCNNAMHGTMK